MIIIIHSAKEIIRNHLKKSLQAKRYKLICLRVTENLRPL